ncbi:hypothetical protein KNV09_gp069 [Vibrio phage Athena]|uniref:Uncharacterized protein n=1 Tax=Vibrio phage Athena TaxID=2736262 RepID=A0A6M9Z396_9CAUD|nr:hypothetical protein KNV09_gp069 [Vibrio phage Athena]QKN85713.1 hypothetical protein ATHENA_69 [Vibrio phage Athena]
MDREESVGTIEWLLKTRKYTEQERNHIIDLANKTWGAIYDKTERKFKRRVFTCPLVGNTIYNKFYAVVPDHEEENYAM